MLRRTFLVSAAAILALRPAPQQTRGELFAAAARRQLGLTTGYDPAYTRIGYPNGDVPRSTGVCADVIVRAARDAFSLDLQRLIHEDMQRDFSAYPHTWGLTHPDANIDHRRVLNLEVFWRRAGAQLWTAHEKTAGNDFGSDMQTGDILTWLLDGRLPHVGIVVGTGISGPRIVHNIGGGVQEISLLQMRSQHAKAHFRWPV